MNKIEDNIEASNIQVVAAEKELAQVVRKVKGSMYPVVGALLGSFVGGPLGFVAGLKIGTLTAITGSIIGKHFYKYSYKLIINKYKDFSTINY